MREKRCVVVFNDVTYDADGYPFPPIGTFGTVISELDHWDEYDVMFDNYPCPTPPEDWVTHKRMIVFIGDYIDIKAIKADVPETIHE